jgi:hypothetical protein
MGQVIKEFPGPFTQAVLQDDAIEWLCAIPVTLRSVRRYVPGDPDYNAMNCG